MKSPVDSTGRRALVRTCLIEVALGLVLACFFAGCATNKPKSDRLDALLHLERGQSQQEVDRVFGPSQHEFTAKFGDDVVRCVAVSFDWKGTYYFVFTNDALGKVCRSPPFEFRRYPYKDVWAEIPDHSEPEKRMAKVLQLPDLTRAALAELLKPPEPQPGGEPMNVLPAFIVADTLCILLAPITVPITVSMKSHSRAQEREVLRRFDPQKVRLGMSVEGVEELFGRPYMIEAMEAERQIGYYGSVTFRGKRDHWVSVVYENRRATCVFTREFFDLNKIYPRY